MAATPARIGFVLEAYRRAVSETAAAGERHGNLARETADPLETWFSARVDAQARADERQDLLSEDRRLFSLTVVDAEEMLALLDAEGPITALFVDEERDINKLMVVTELSIDMERQVATVKVWG